MSITKTLRFDNEVVEVFRNMVWSDDGLTADITAQLSASLYKKVKKAIEATSGSWDKKAKVHRFSKDPRPEILGIIENGTLTVERDGFFPTPPEVTRYIMGRMALGMGDYNWLEPEAGDGAMVKVLLEQGQYPERIYCIERNTDRCEKLRKLGVRVANRDFLKYNHSSGIIFNRILMNPPFENHQDILHIMKAYYVLAEGGVMASILGEGAFISTHTIAVEFRAWLKSIHARIEKLPEGSFKESGTMVNTRFVVIHK